MKRLFRSLAIVALALTSQLVEAKGRDVFYPAHDQTTQHGLYFEAEKPRALLLVIHGMQSHSGWFDASGTGDYLAENGITSLAFDRRGSGLSGSRRGDADSAGQLLTDISDAVKVLRTEARARLGEAVDSLPLHVLANCFGTRLIVPYIEKRPEVFASLILTSPALEMRKQADYDPLKKAEILLAPEQTYFKTPLKDRYFSTKPEILQWLKEDSAATRKVTAGFLRAASKLTRKMNKAIFELRTPLLVLGATRDAVVKTGEIRDALRAKYRGPLELQVLDSEHTLEFGDSKDQYRRYLVDWILNGS